MEPKIILLVGPPASGKTTWARSYQATHTDTVIVGRDKLREMLFGYSEASVAAHYLHQQFKERENVVTTYQHVLIREALAKGNTVIIDDTNLDTARINRFKSDYDRFEVEIVVVHAERSSCVHRNLCRSRQVDSNTLHKLYDRYEAMVAKGLPASSQSPVVRQYVPDESLPAVYIVDLDGTLASHSHRKPYGCTDEEILADQPIQPVVDLVKMLIEQGHDIQFLSGREDRYHVVTWEWLCAHIGAERLEFCSLYMRSTGDFRKDSVIKQELFWSMIAPNYQVMAAIDDRKQVKQMWHDMGVFVFDVNQTDAWF